MAVLADPEAIADGLNPLTISHTESVISPTGIGPAKMSSNPDPEVHVDIDQHGTS